MPLMVTVYWLKQGVQLSFGLRPATCRAPTWGAGEGRTDQHLRDTMTCEVVDAAQKPMPAMPMQIIVGVPCQERAMAADGRNCMPSGRDHSPQLVCRTRKTLDDPAPFESDVSIHSTTRSGGRYLSLRRARFHGPHAVAHSSEYVHDSLHSPAPTLRVHTDRTVSQ